jgi:hypothetical protein
MKEGIFVTLIGLVGVGMSALMGAWFTIFPVLGLLWCIGVLK